MVSWGIGCATNQFPGVSARVSSVYNDIREFVCAKSTTPPLDFQCQELGFNTDVVDTKTPTSNPTILPSSLSEIDPNLFVDTEVMQTSKPTSNPTIVPPSLSEIYPSQLPTTKSNKQTVPLQTSSTSTNIAKTSLTSVSLAFVLSFF